MNKGKFDQSTFNEIIFDLDKYNVTERVENAKACIDLAKHFTCFGSVDADMYNNACEMLQNNHANGLVAAALTGNVSANEIIKWIEVKVNCDLKPGERVVEVKFPSVEEYIKNRSNLKSANVSRPRVIVSDGKNLRRDVYPSVDNAGFRLYQYEEYPSGFYEDDCAKHSIILLHMFAHGEISSRLWKSDSVMSRYGFGMEFETDAEKIPAGTLVVDGVDDSEWKKNLDVFSEIKHSAFDEMEVNRIYLPARLVRAQGKFGYSDMLINDHWTNRYAKKRMIRNLKNRGVDYDDLRGDRCDVIYGVASACILRKK